jgi:hypothetical protein
MVWAGVATGLLVAAAPAAAQTVARSDEKMFIGGTGGISAVQNVGGVFGGEFGFRVSPRFDIVAEGLGFTDIATRRRIEAAESVAAVIQASQGQPATGTLKSPAFLGVGGVRIGLYQSGGVRVYVEGTGGFGRVASNPTFTLNGADITSQLQQFGVALGLDLAGTSTHAAFGGAIGVDVKRNKWYVGGHFGVTSVQTPSQATKVLQAGATIGRWF